jgi:mRNA interferase MazF
MEIQRGEIWLIDLNPIKGREQAGVRPALIISVDPFNNSMAELVIALPITTKSKGIPLHIKIMPPEGNIKEVSYIKCEDIRSISKERLIQCWGKVTEETLFEVEKILSLLLGLK